MPFPRTGRAGIRSFRAPTFYPYEQSGLIADLDEATLSVTGEAGGYVPSLIVGSASTINLSISDFELITIPSISGSGSIVGIRSSASVVVINNIHGNATVTQLKADGTGLLVNTINGEANIFRIEAVGLAQLYSTVVQAPDGEYPYISGDTYIVVNLRTKSHTTYKDGSSAAIAKTGEMSFDSFNDKNIADVYLLARATEDVELIVKNNEITERNYPVIFGTTGQANLKNKKVMLAKGLKGQNWQMSVVALDDYAEVRSIEMLVNELKRRV